MDRVHFARFAEDWLLSLERDTVISLSLFLTYNLVSLMNFTMTNAAEYRSVQRTGVLWSNEHLNKKVTEYVRQNANVKGKPNLTKHSLCQWINKELLPNENLEPGFPRHISVETMSWVLRFSQLTKECFLMGMNKDVVQEREMLI